jgi:excisionase family DNA binding protein
MFNGSKESQRREIAAGGRNIWVFKMTQGNTGRETDAKRQDTRVHSEYLPESDSKTSGSFFDSRISSSNWLTTKEAAAYVRSTPKQLRKWVYQGRVEAYRFLGKSLRFKRTELDLLFKGGPTWE